MPNDFIPQNDDDFIAWMTTFLAYATANLGALGLVAGDLVGLTAAKNALVSARATQVSTAAAAKVATAAKNVARDEAGDAFRGLARILQASIAMTDPHRAGLGITVPDTTPSGAAAPATRPVAIVDASQRLEHRLTWVDEATPTKRARPADATAREIWRAILPQGAAAPASASQLTFVARDTAAPYLTVYDGADAGKVAWFWLRWINDDDNGHGPWGVPVSATIGG